MIEFARLYFLACELKPTLPEHKLLRLLPPKQVELLISAVKSGIGSGLANYDQLAALYEMGKSENVSHENFKTTLSGMLEEAISAKSNISIDERIQLWGKLAKYYESRKIAPPVVRKFNEQGPELVLFATGFAPLDKVLGKNKKPGEIIPTEVITIIAQPGTGKSYISLAIANAWKHGPVLLYDPENGEGLVMSRANSAVKVGDPEYDNKRFIFGHYDPDDILAYIQDNPMEGLLVILDSMHCICGDGRSPASGAEYERMLRIMSAMKKYAKLIIGTTQVKRGADGDDLEAAAASASIERWTGAQIHLSKEDELEDNLQQYRMYCSKNRSGVQGQEVRFAFDYEKAKTYLIEPQKYTPTLLDDMESF